LIGHNAGLIFKLYIVSPFENLKIFSSQPTTYYRKTLFIG
jgi:hypothetical protein